jgi:hypothetical protein
VLYNGEPETCASFLAGTPFVHTIKSLKDAGQMFLFNTLAIILKADATKSA